MKIVLNFAVKCRIGTKKSRRDNLKEKIARQTKAKNIIYKSLGPIKIKKIKICTNTRKYAKKESFFGEIH